MTHLYVHIPFCKTICSYCDFAKVLQDSFDVNAYLDMLEKEIKTKIQNQNFETIYIGGGTPTALSEKQLERLISILAPLAKQCVEYTIEMNVETMTDKKLELIAGAGINRISIGVQTFNPKLLKVIERQHTNEMVYEWLSKINKVGISNASIDMMYALPFQTIEQLSDDLQCVTELIDQGLIQHISYYALQLEDNTKFALAKLVEMQDDLQLSYYQMIENKLREFGFNKYEISNFARENYTSIHNRGYWLHHDYAALGLGAHGYENYIRYENTRSMTKYLNGEFELERYSVSVNGQMEDEVLFGLRMVEGINKTVFFNRYQKRIEDVFVDVNDLVEQGQLVDDGNYLKVHHDFFFNMNLILIHFLLD